MSQNDREAFIRAEVQRLGAVPSCRAMSAAFARSGATVSMQTVSRLYHRLSIHSGSKGGRPDVGSTQVHPRIPDAVYDQLCRVAKQRRVSVNRIAAAVVTAWARDARSARTVSDTDSVR